MLAYKLAKITKGFIVDSMTFKYRRKITITEQSGSDLTGYQVRIDLDATNFDFSHFLNEGKDLRFTDASGNLLPYWVEKMDITAQEATIWVKVPSIPANSSVEIFMYYGNSQVGSASRGDNTFYKYSDFEPVVAKYIVNWTKSPNNPLNDFDSQIWLAACYDGEKIWLFFKQGIGGSPGIEAYSFKPEDAHDFSKWNYEGYLNGLGPNDYEDWESYHREPHGVIYETQAMADARTGVPGSERMWRLYYCATAGGEENYGCGYAISSDLKNWIRMEDENPLPIESTTPPNGNADPHVALYNNKMYLFTRRALGGTTWVTKVFYCAEEASQGSNANWVDLGVFDDSPYTSAFGICALGVESGITFIGATNLSGANDEYPATFFSGIFNFFYGYTNNPVLVASDAWEAGRFGHGCLVQTKDYTGKIDGKYYLFYSAGDSLSKLGLAISETLVSESHDASTGGSDNWQISSGVLKHVGDASDSVWIDAKCPANLAIETEMRVNSDHWGKCCYRSNLKQAWWQASVNQFASGIDNYGGKDDLTRVDGGTEVLLVSHSRPDYTTFTRWSIRAFGASHKIYKDGVLILEATDGNYQTDGFVGFAARVDSNFEVKWVAVRKYAEPEPLISIRAEETA